MLKLLLIEQVQQCKRLQQNQHRKSQHTQKILVIDSNPLKEPFRNDTMILKIIFKK
jgi:hypothetical protein